MKKHRRLIEGTGSILAIVLLLLSPIIAGLILRPYLRASTAYYEEGMPETRCLDGKKLIRNPETGEFVYDTRSLASLFFASNECTSHLTTS